MTIRIFSILMISFLSILTTTLSMAHGDEVPQEYYVKAKYLLNIPLFTEMPPQANKATSYTICIIGDTPMVNVMEASKIKLIKNRPLIIKRVENISQADGCQMLYVASSERHRLQALLPEAHRRGILTISDMRDFARLGGIITLLTVDNRIAFDLNLAAASKASISFSTHLLKLAHDIIN